MSCTNCTGTSSFSLPNLQNICSSGVKTDTMDVVYTGPILSCIGVQPNTCLQDIIQSINTKVCQSVGDYTQYNFNCLEVLYPPITNEEEFVFAITDYACKLSDRVDDLENTLNTEITNIQTQIDNIVSPGLVSNCPSLVIYDINSTLDQIITAQTNAICSINANLSLTGVLWSKCYTVTTPPITIVDGFNEVINQICLTKAAISTGGLLPTFDNTGTCLSAPTATDSLVDTIIKIRSRLCLTPTFVAANLPVSTCVQFSGASTLEQVIAAQNNQIDQVSTQSIRGASSQFVLTPIDPSQPCLGRTIALNTSVIDRNVASNSADTTPGTLFDKLQAGTNFNLDFSTTPGKVILNATGAALSDEKVKATSTDPSSGYLDSKLIGDSSDPIIQIAVTSLTSSLRVTPSLDLTALATALLDTIQNNTTLKAKFCEITNSCPVACSVPTNVSVTFQS